MGGGLVVGVNVLSLIQCFTFLPGVLPCNISTPKVDGKAEDAAASAFSDRASDSTKNRIASTLSFLISVHHSET